VVAAPPRAAKMNADDPHEDLVLSAHELATLRAEIERAGFERDPLVGEHADRMHYGLNITVAWPLGATIDAAYRAFEKRVALLDSGTYVYPLATTHITVLTAVSFKRYPDPSSQTIRAIDAAAGRLDAFLAGDARDIGPFTLEIGPPVLARGAAFLPMKNATGEISRVRERALAFCRAAGGVLADASAPRAIHSTVLRFREQPRDPIAFARAFDAIARTLHFGSMTIDRLLVTLETKPYMRAGRVMDTVALGRSGE
jgi:hypothetical protein